MLGTIAVVLVFGGLIFFHELGHFCVARAFGVGVKTFSLGFGPRLYSFKRGKTLYQLAAIPLGGFVSMVGESASADIPEPFTPEESFTLRPAWQRFLIIAAGAAFNLLLAWIVCWGLVFANGRIDMSPVVGEILENSAAAASPMQVGDRILSLDGQPVSRWEELFPIVQKQQGKELAVVVKKADTDAVHSFSMTPTLLKQRDSAGKEVETWGMGIRPVRHSYGFWESSRQGMLQAATMVAFIRDALVDLLSRKIAFDNVGGPILLAQAIYTQAGHGLDSVLMMAALISVNLGVLNLLPIPVLDGGHLIFLIVEMISRRRVPVAVQEKAAYVGLVLLLSLMVAATYNDILRFFD